MIAGRKLNLALLMLVIRLVDGRKAHLGTRRPDSGMTHSIMKSNLNVSFGKKWKKGIKVKEEYLVAKRRAKSTVYFAKRSANDKKFGDLNSTEQRNLIFKMAHKMKDHNKDIIGVKCVKDQEGNMAFHDNSKAKNLAKTLFQPTKCGVSMES